MNDATIDKIGRALDDFAIELPSWGFADTGTRFGKFFQDAAASTLEDKLHDAGLVHKLTGSCPDVAVHVLWDFPPGSDAAGEPKQVAEQAAKHGIRIGSINPNVFQDQHYKYGSYCSPWAEAREAALQHTLESVEIGAAVGSKVLTLWLADGTNYPGQDSIYRRKAALHEALGKIHRRMEEVWPDATMLIEYKPFEPGFYHTDIADWGMAYTFAKQAGKNARVLVDTGHHLPGANIEHIVAFLLAEGMLGGFHFNDRKYADDDLTLASIDPYAAFRIFDQIEQHRFETGRTPSIAYMVDQSHNLKPKLEAMVQTVEEAQKLRARAAIVDREALRDAQQKTDIVAAERIVKAAFEADVSEALRQWRKGKGLPEDPVEELRSSGIIDKLGKERAAARRERGEVQAASYA